MSTKEKEEEVIASQRAGSISAHLAEACTSSISRRVKGINLSVTGCDADELCAAASAPLLAIPRTC